MQKRGTTKESMTDSCEIMFSVDEWLSRIHFFVTDRSFAADVGLLSPTGSVKTTPQKTRFRDVKVARIGDTD